MKVLLLCAFNIYKFDFKFCDALHIKHILIKWLWKAKSDFTSTFSHWVVLLGHCAPHRALHGQPFRVCLSRAWTSHPCSENCLSDDQAVWLQNLRDTNTLRELALYFIPGWAIQRCRNSRVDHAIWNCELRDFQRTSFSQPDCGPSICSLRNCLERKTMGLN